MAEGDLRLGKVAFVDKGTYSASTTYNTFNFVVTEDSCYLCVKDANKGHDLTDTAWWKCLANGKPATEATKRALVVIADAVEKTTLANNAAVRAGSAAGLANQRAEEALAAKENVLSVLNQVIEMLALGNAQIDSMKAAELSLMSQALLAPNRIELKYTPVICTRNKVKQKIEALLFPRYVLQNVIYQQPPRFGDSVYVDPDGSLGINKVGKTKVHVIPTHNTSLYQTVEIEVRDPVMRKLGNGKLRLSENGKIRLI